MIAGWSVTRLVPPDVWGGLIIGKYKMYGGVIRWAAGTERAGQIVRHLVPVASQVLGGGFFDPISTGFDLLNTYQLHKLSKQVAGVSGQINALTAATRQILQVATSTMALSGLNLAVTAVGFTVLNDKLKTLEGRLSELQSQVKALRGLLELEERSRLSAALRDLLNVSGIKNPSHRHDMLFNSKNILAPISLKYKELLAGAETLEIAMAYEEYFCLTSLAHTRCLAELGMLEMACRDLDETSNFWVRQARRITNEFLLEPDPERFLSSDFVQDVPVSGLVEWLDFAYGEEKGYGWIDELRGRIGPWYSQGNSSELAKGSKQVISSVKRMVTKQTPFLNVDSIERQRTRVIPSLQKLVARNNVLEGYKTQYQLLETHNITPSDFESQVAALAESAVDGFLILRPSEEKIGSDK